MTPERTFFFRSTQYLPRFGLGPSKGLFELTHCPSRALNFASSWRYKDTKKPLKTDENLDCVFVKKAHLSICVDP